jgi:hypothetical protein
MKSSLPERLKPIFWSWDFDKIDIEKNKRTIIVQVLNYGKMRDWQWLTDTYGRDNLKATIVEMPTSEFSPRTVELFKLVFGIKKMKYASRSDYIRNQERIG